MEIQGFKSFASRTVLEFLPAKNERLSITAVVGPNGAGKSNVADAIRWGLGEQSLKVLRGKKSEDVIFNGSESKGPMGASEVTLTFDNADGRVLPEYPEITITRRLYRSGEGEYLVNNNQARLFDVRVLLAQAQFAEHAYSVVGQGMIDQLLILGAPERKNFLDEASGIKEFQIKRHQADLKLERTADNMAQAERLLEEVEPRLRLLSRQVKKLEKRQEVELKLRETQEKYYATLFTRNQKETKELLSRLEEVENNYRRFFSELEKVQDELSALARSESRPEAFQALQNRLSEAERAKNEIEKDLAVLEGQMRTEYSQAGRQNVGWLEGKIKELKGVRQKIENDLNGAYAEAERVKKLFSDEQKILQNLSVDRTELVVKISRLQNDMLKEQSEHSYLQFSGLTAVKAVLDNKQRFGHIFGLLSELGDVDETYRQALETAAGAYLSAVVTDDEKTARLAINYLRDNRLGVATFLPLGKIRGRDFSSDAQSFLNADGVVGAALDLIKFDEKFREIFSFVLGGTLVVKNLLAAEKLGLTGRTRFVTLDGDLGEKSGVLKGGWRQRKGPGFSSKISFSVEDRLSVFRAEIGLAQQNLAESDKKIEAAKERLLKIEREAGGADAKTGVLSEERKKLEKEIASLEKEFSLLQASPEEYGAELGRLAKDKERLLKEGAERSEAVEKLAEEIKKFNEKEEEKKQRVFSLQAEMQKKQEAVNAVLNERNDLKIEVAKLETKREALEQEVLSDMNTALTAIMERNPEVVAPEDLPAVSDDIQKLKYQLSLIGGIDEEIVAEHAATREKYDFLTGQLDDLRKATDDLRVMIEDLDNLMKQKREAAFKKIRKEFDRYFKILFNGGSASLEEVYGEPEPEPDTDASVQGIVEEAATSVAPEEIKNKKTVKILTGIDIHANPPGKKVKHLNALSGGERTLTSIALICAILNYNPSPFVVLDEVEAALDEANTARFVKIMGELSTRSQFIIITHNRVTMHAADALYGVVMGGDGVSKLLSVKMEEAEKYGDVDKKM